LGEITDRFRNFQRVEFSQLELEESAPSTPPFVHRIRGQFDLDVDFEIRLAQKGRVSLAPFAEKVSRWLASKAGVVLVSRTEQQGNRIRDILENYDVHVDRMARGWNEVPDGPGLTICLGRLAKGFTWPDLNLYVVSEDEIFGPKKGRPIQRAKGGIKPLSSSAFGQLKEGDLVVHEDHGVGRYGGLLKMEVARKVNDFAVIEYAGNDKLYVPADRLSVLQKYLGADESNTKMDHLGGRSWDLAKEKAKKSVKRIARQLIELYALRRYRQGFAFSPPDNYYREFEATFEHEETPDQSKVIEEVLEDMASEQPMDRLICGDVGFGKTEVAIRAAFKAVSDGKQVALLVPTTVLAEQHYEEFRTRMAPYPISVGILSRFKTPAEQSETAAKVRSGKIDLLIGTHRILQKDIQFKDLGLLIIDEEQRFGVKQKEALKKYRALVDVLAITATPIPRTLHMSMMGVRDLSIIETPPQDRQDIETYLSPFDEGTIIRALRFEKERGGQIFFVHNRVQTIDLLADQLRRMVPEVRFAVAHGQMKERDLENTMMRFLHREIDVLVCTTIIESGLDIPTANTIFINEADRLGLAQIYQLRGRVGRAKEKAYAYLLLTNGAHLTKDSEKRLKALMDFSHLGAGLQLAMHDLKIRGGGNILGFSQAGHISAVGYELYMKLIEQSIAELKGEDWHEEINPEISMDIPAYLPGDYVADADVRLNLYRRLSSLREKTDLAALMEEIHDRFGPPPQESMNLFGLMSIRSMMKTMGIGRLDVGKESLILTFSQDHRIDPAVLLKRLGSQKRKFHFLPGNKLKLTIGPMPMNEELQRVEEIIASLSPA
jgi:transcription-repair coupling factor (superfamily II helicase)